MEIISVTPRGYCQGVVRAIRIAEETAGKHPGETITMLGMIVHNRYVVQKCESLGIRCIEDSSRTRLELLDDIDEGIVIITAHGANDAVFAKAQSKGLQIVDATCPDVEKTHTLVRRHVEHGDVIYLGKHNHPEAEGTVGISPRVHLVSSVEEAEQLEGLADVLITSQTTLSILDTRRILDACLRKYPDAKVYPEVCNATRIRQEAVLRLRDTDVLIVVGDPHSNNSHQLARIGQDNGIPRTWLIENADQLRDDMIAGAERVAVTSGSSTPNELTQAVIDRLHALAQQ